MSDAEDSDSSFTLALGERTMPVVSQSIVVPLIEPTSMLATPTYQRVKEQKKWI
jgi:hypothetical protein